MSKRLLIAGGVLVSIGLAAIPVAVSADSARPYGVTASSSVPSVDCSEPDPTFDIPVQTVVKYNGAGAPSAVTAKYIGGSDVALSLLGVSGDVATYTGTVAVPRSVFCDDAPAQIRFRGLATQGNGDTRGEGTFSVTSIAGAPDGETPPGGETSLDGETTSDGETPPDGETLPPDGQTASLVDGRYVVTAATSTPEVDCSSDDDPITVDVTATVQYSGLGQPDTVVAKYLGGIDVVLTLQAAVGDVATYTGSLAVPRSLLCDGDDELTLRFRVLATDEDTRGEGIFYVSGVEDEEPPTEPPADNRYQVSASTTTPTVNCADIEDNKTFAIQVTALVNYRLLGRPDLVVGKTLGGADVVLTFQGASGDIATYTGTILVSKAALCTDPPTTLRFRVLATDEDTRGEGIFFVTSVAGPSQGSGSQP